MSIWILLPPSPTLTSRKRWRTAGFPCGHNGTPVIVQHDKPPPRHTILLLFFRYTHTWMQNITATTFTVAITHDQTITRQTLLLSLHTLFDAFGWVHTTLWLSSQSGRCTPMHSKRMIAATGRGSTYFGRSLARFRHRWQHKVALG